MTMNLPPEIIAAALQPISTGISAGLNSISTRIKTAKTSSDKQETINELENIINELIENQNELVRNVSILQNQIAMQTISDEDLNFITENLIPLVKNLLEQTSKTPEELDKLNENISLFESLISTKLLKILQLVGFNIKEAVGIPSTELVKHLIQNNNDNTQTTETDLQLKALEYTMEMSKLAADPEAYERYINLLEKNQ
ncbi:hypothetical protein SAMN04489868_1792 [Pisciglobus halotolerans]|uniref:Uncharacterized protein n=2 Tax=Pisciglobus halotolerans TaxID=745365 RepID=A0A1I3E8G3_9LACT|nr:hypothetical protein SAMN04489868_1792 [Pisciglobus halotolerans]